MSAIIIVAVVIVAGALALAFGAIIGAQENEPRTRGLRSLDDDELRVLMERRRAEAKAEAKGGFFRAAADDADVADACERELARRAKVKP